MAILKIAAAVTETVRLMEQGLTKKDQVIIVIQQTEVVLLPERVRLVVIQGVITDLLHHQDHILQVPEEVPQDTEEVLLAREAVQEEDRCLIIILIATLRLQIVILLKRRIRFKKQALETEYLMLLQGTAANINVT